MQGRRGCAPLRTYSILIILMTLLIALSTKFKNLLPLLLLCLQASRMISSSLALSGGVVSYAVLILLELSFIIYAMFPRLLSFSVTLVTFEYIIGLQH